MPRAKRTSEVAEKATTTAPEASEVKPRAMELHHFLEEHRIDPLMVAFYKAVARELEDDMSARTEEDWQATFEKVGKLPVN